MLDRLPPFLRPLYESVFCAADEAYYNGRVDATTKAKQVQYKHWCAFVAPLGVDPELQNTPYITRVRCISGFVALTRRGYYGRGKQVQAGTVSGAVTSIGQAIALVHEINPTKRPGSKKFVPRVEQMLIGWGNDDPLVASKMPV